MEGRRYPQLGDAEWLRRRYLDDEASLDDIAAELGCQKSTLRQALAAAAVPTRPPGRRRRLRALREEELLELIRRRGQGSAAGELGIDPKTLYRDIRRLGILEQAKAASRAHRRNKRADPPASERVDQSV
jgi:DNA-binding transcriptional ArsR family regulator